MPEYCMKQLTELDDELLRKKVNNPLSVTVHSSCSKVRLDGDLKESVGAKGLYRADLAGVAL